MELDPVRGMCGRSRPALAMHKHADLAACLRAVAPQQVSPASGIGSTLWDISSVFGVATATAVFTGSDNYLTPAAPSADCSQRCPPRPSSPPSAPSAPPSITPPRPPASPHTRRSTPGPVRIGDAGPARSPWQHVTRNSSPRNNTSSGRVYALGPTIDLPTISAATRAGTRRLRLLSVTSRPSASVLGWQVSHLSTDRMGAAKVSRRAMELDPVRGMIVRHPLTARRVVTCLGTRFGRNRWCGAMTCEFAGRES